MGQKDGVALRAKHKPAHGWRRRPARTGTANGAESHMVAYAPRLASAPAATPPTGNRSALAPRIKAELLGWAWGLLIGEVG